MFCSYCIEIASYIIIFHSYGIEIASYINMYSISYISISISYIIIFHSYGIKIASYINMYSSPEGNIHELQCHSILRGDPLRTYILRGRGVCPNKGQ